MSMRCTNIWQPSRLKRRAIARDDDLKKGKNGYRTLVGEGLKEGSCFGAQNITVHRDSACFRILASQS